MVDLRAVTDRLQTLSHELRSELAFIPSRGGVADRRRVEATVLVASCLGKDHYLVDKLENWVSFSAANRFARTSPVDELCGYVDAAVALIDSDGLSPRRMPTCDPELWVHVEPLVESAIWDKIPSTVVTFVEDWFRRTAGDPPNKKGGKLYGSGLFAEILRPGGSFSLGADPSEMEGWRDLGVGLAKAVGNGHRHTINTRDDAEQLAWNVIGLGSLLISEMRRTHGATTTSS
ncbi:TIGR02391 family protein [Nocardioides sp. W7]|uniref:TIGR02391 family protein n=1 Tax=Nocardioides sp. W7 TaxID=2931390 RepID=UPI001FD47536|nr:TIGR02391 family protein [Nocardioides sp. W7]